MISLGTSCFKSDSLFFLLLSLLLTQYATTTTTKNCFACLFNDANKFSTALGRMRNSCVRATQTQASIWFSCFCGKKRPQGKVLVKFQFLGRKFLRWGVCMPMYPVSALLVVSLGMITTSLPLRIFQYRVSNDSYEPRSLFCLTTCHKLNSC